MSRIQGSDWLPAAALAAVLLAVPLWCVTTPGMPDYPAHLASFALIAGEASKHYFVQWAALPNLASEGLVPLLGRWMPLETATQLFLTATILMWVLGPALIQRALFGRIGPGVLLSAMFAYNANFIWGFFNYSFATGLSFLVFAAWIATERRRGVLPSIGFAVLFAIVYFSHLFALAALLLAIGGYELSGLIAERFSGAAIVRRVIVPALMLIPAALAFMLFKPAGTATGHFAFNIIGTFQDRFEAAIEIGFDKPLVPLTVALIVLFLAATVTGFAKVHPRMRIVLALFTLGALFAPEWALGGWGVHMRLPAVLGALAFASLEWIVSPRVARIGASVAGIMLLMSATLLMLDWRGYDAQYRDFRAHDGTIPRDARILTVLDGDSLGWSADQPYWHMAEFAIIDRGAFTPLMFTTSGQHVIHIRPPNEAVAAQTAQQGSPPDIDELDDLAQGRMEVDPDYQDVFPYLEHFQCHFDEAIVIRGKGARSRIPGMLRLRQDGSFYGIYDIVRDKSCR
jgi:hypothetical protein